MGGSNSGGQPASLAPVERRSPGNGGKVLMIGMEIALAVAKEVDNRQTVALKWRMKAAVFSLRKHFDTSDYPAVPSQNKQKAAALASCGWVDER